MNVAPNGRIKFKGITYRGGDLLPSDYKDETKKPEKKATPKKDKKEVGDGN